MSVGLYDNDLMNHDFDFFNLELMKLSAWYKRKGEIVKLSPFFEPDRFTKFFFQKDGDLNNLPIDFFQTQRISYGGRYFSELYQPLEHELIYPDKTIYEGKENYFKDKQLFKSLMGGEHCRLSFNGQEISKDYQKQISDIKNCYSLFFYDYDLVSLAGGHQELLRLQDIRETKNELWKTHLGFKFPLQFNSIADLLKWQDIRFKRNATVFNINFAMTAEEFLTFYSLTAEGKYKCRLINYNPFHEKYTDELWCKLYNQLLVSSNEGLPIILNIDNLSEKNKSIARLLNHYLKWAYHKQEKTGWGYAPPFSDFIKMLKWTPEEFDRVKQTLTRLRQSYPEFFERLKKYHCGEAKEELENDWS